MAEQLDDDIAIVFEGSLAYLEKLRLDAYAQDEKLMDSLKMLSNRELVGILEYVAPDQELYFGLMWPVLWHLDERQKIADSQNDNRQVRELKAVGQAIVDLNKAHMHRDRSHDHDLSKHKHPDTYAGAITQSRNVGLYSDRRSLFENFIIELAQDLTPEEIVAISQQDFSPLLDADRVHMNLYRALIMPYMEALEEQNESDIARYAGALVATGHKSIVDMYADWKPPA